MDMTGGSLDRLTSQIQPALSTLTAALKGAETELSVDEKAALDAFSAEVGRIFKAETDIVSQIDAAITTQRLAFFADLDRRVSIRIGPPAA